MHNNDISSNINIIIKSQITMTCINSLTITQNITMTMTITITMTMT